MLVSIKMDADIANGTDPRIRLISPSRKEYILDGTVRIYGSKSVAYGARTIVLMSIDADFKDEDIEDGEYIVEATVLLPTHRLNSDIMKLNLRSKTIIVDPEKEAELAKQGNGFTTIM